MGKFPFVVFILNEESIVCHQNNTCFFAKLMDANIHPLFATLRIVLTVKNLCAVRREN
jgi:hypothetical protein